MSNHFYTVEDVPLDSAVIQEYYERWRYPEIIGAEASELVPLIIDDTGSAHYGVLTDNPELRERVHQSEYQLKEFRDSVDLFREIYQDFSQELPGDTTEKEQIIYLKLVLGDDLSAPSKSVIGLSTQIERSYATQFQYDRSNQTVFERGYISDELRRELINEYSGCAKCGEDGDIEIHHIIPFAQGGQTVTDNLVPLCSDCHRAAHGSNSYESKESFWRWIQR